MIVAIPAVIVIAIIITLALVFLFKVRRVKQRGFPHERFDDSIIDHGQDGSIIASNQLFDLHSANGASHSPPDDKLTISQNGNAYYSRGSPLQFDSDSNAFTNPLYESAQETNLNNGAIATLPVNEELNFGASSKNDENETQT
ncbi:hypothetical protein ACJMK2_043551 [Sinanodonta woodiana]|uniref:Uncharacterized protein n=1 Tax=Sinanodonta woodiana TaxID=1069815 RepID=A0ABD3VX39_SINWO